MTDIDLTQLDIYGIIGIENGIDATDKQIKLAYNAMALKTHPDRHPDDPQASEKFDLLKRAYEFIRVPENRTTYNARLRLLEERQKQAEAQDEGMRRMLQRLAEGEQAAESKRSQPILPSLSSIARHRSTTYIESLQRQGILGAVSGIHTTVNLTRPSAQPQPSTSAPPTASVSSKSADIGTGTLDDMKQRSLVLKWRKSSRAYNPTRATQEGITAAVAPWGQAVSVHIRPSSTSDKCKAVVVLATQEQALAANRGLLGDAMFQAEPMETASVDVTEVLTTEASSSSADQASYTVDDDDDEEPFVDLEMTTLAKLRSIQTRIQASNTIVLDE